MNRITSGICAISASLALSLCLTACSSEPSDEVASQAGSAAGKVVSQAEDSAKKASEIKIGETITVPIDTRLRLPTTSGLMRSKSRATL